MDNPREKARELVYKFAPYSEDDATINISKMILAKCCADIAVGLIIEELEDYTGEDTKFWKEVRNEIIEL